MLINFYRGIVKFVCIPPDSAPEAPILQLVTDNTALYYFSLIQNQSTNNSNGVDVDSYEATIIGSNFSEMYTLSNSTSNFMLPSLYQYSENVTLEVVAIDRCGQESLPAVVAISGM